MTRDTRPMLPLDLPATGSRPQSSARQPAITPHKQGNRRRSANRSGFTGTAVSINRRFESRRRLPTEQVATFRLERYDARGDRRPPISVELRGLTITGGISEGERVRVSGRMRGGVLVAHEVHSLTTGGIMSTRALSLVEHRLGRRGALATVLVLLVLGVVAVRFVPQIYYNTPFGKGEYRADVTGTCERVTAIGQQPLPAPSRIGSSPSADPDDNLRYDRDTVEVYIDGRHDAISTEYRILLDRITPVALMTRRNQVTRLIARQNSLFATQDAEIAALPAEFSLTQLQATSLRTQAAQEQLDSELGAAMTALAGRTCSV